MRVYTNVVVVILVGVCAGVFLGVKPTHAAPCTNSYGTGSTAPTGYGVAYNLFSTARERLVEGTDCTTTSATVQVGSGNAAQFVHNKGYYWSGSKWTEYSLTGTSAGSGWLSGKGTGNVQLPQTVTYVVGYVCQQVGGVWKCGCRDTSCTTAYWQLQAVKGPNAPGGGGGSGGGNGGGGTMGEQCKSLTPPPQAQAVGLTKLEFCDDFNVQSLSLTNDLDIKGDYKWSRELPWNWRPEAASAFTFKDGVMRIAPTQNNVQWTLTSALNKGGQLHGYAIDGSKPYYVEIRWKYDHDKVIGKGFPAFWSMAACHTIKWPNACPNNEFIEPDYFEFINGREITATHFHDRDYEKMPVTRCNLSMPDAIDRTQWHTNGALAQAPMSITYYQNNIERNKLTPDDNCVSKQPASTGKASDVLNRLGKHYYPVHIGSGEQMPIEVDWVTVWVRP